MNDLTRHVEELARQIHTEQETIHRKETELRLAERDFEQKEKAYETSKQRVEHLEGELKTHRASFTTAKHDLEQSTKQMNETIKRAA